MNVLRSHDVPSPTEARSSGERVLAVDLGGTKCHGVVADGDGAILEEVLLGIGPEGEVSERLLECLRELRRRADGIVRAAAIGVPALIDPATGLAEVGSNVSWHGYDVAALVRSEVTEPFRIDNDVNLAAVGEARVGEGRSAGSFVTLSLGTGVGAAIVVGGELLRGHHDAAGEVGYLSVSRDALPDDRSAPIPELESLVSGPGLLRQAAHFAHPDWTAEDVLEAAAAGDGRAEQVVDLFLERLASLVADIGALLDPGLVVLDGGLGRGLEPWCSDIQRRVNARISYPPEVLISRVMPSAAVVGAVCTALELVRAADDAPALHDREESARAVGVRGR